MHYSLDALQIFKTNTSSFITYQGWAMDDTGKKMDVEIVIDNKIIRNEITCKDRPDVYASLMQGVIEDTIGFQGILEVEGEIKKLSLSLNGEVVKVYEGKAIEDCIKDSVITGAIDHVIYNDDVEEYAIFGWAYSVDGKEVSFRVYDNNNNLVDIHVKKEKRYDVARSVGCREDCGYHIWFHGVPHERYTLELLTINSSKKETVHISRYKTIKDNIHNYYHAARTFFKVYGGFDHIKQHGIKASFDRIYSIYNEPKFYDAWFRKQRNKDDTKLNGNIKVSIITPTFNTPIEYLQEMIDSVIHQTYTNWELCLADGSDSDHPARKMIEEYTKKDHRIKVTYLAQNRGISENTNVAIDMASGDYIAFFDHDDFLENNALAEVVSRIEKTNCDLVYTDEDKYLSNSKRFFMPSLKPDYSKYLLLSDNYICHWVVCRSDLVKELKLRKEFDGSQDYDFLLRVSEKTEKIEHVAKVLYHWRMSESSTAFDPESKMYCFDAGKRAIQEHLDRSGIQGSVSMLQPPYYGYYHVQYANTNPKVSIIIPSFEQKDVLERCIHSLLHVNTYKNIEIIIVENNSTSRKIWEYYKKLEAMGIKVITHNQPSFNYSNLNNVGVKHSSGDILLFLNNDTEVLEPDSIQEMVGLAQRKDVGCVGAKLLYDNFTIQHGGVLYSKKINAGHAFVNTDGNEPGTKYLVRTQVNSNFSAVTGACLMVRREVFDEVNGFDETFPVAYNDIDFCFKIRDKGYWIVQCTFSVWKHYESITRGDDLKDQKKLERLKEDAKHLQSKWAHFFAHTDPFYNPNYDEERLFQLKI